MKVKIKRKLEEISAMGGGAVAGHVDNRDELEEISQSSAAKGFSLGQRVSGEEEHEGHVERSKHQGQRSVIEDKKRVKITIKAKISEVHSEKQRKFMCANQGKIKGAEEMCRDTKISKKKA
jgi:hypothetical protein